MTDKTLVTVDWKLLKDLSRNHSNPKLEKIIDRYARRYARRVRNLKAHEQARQ